MWKTGIYIAFLLLFFTGSSLFAQKKKQTKVKDSTAVSQIDPLSPARAAFYSAVLPGLGQAYNKKYWKIPIVYAALGVGTYFYIDNKNEFERYLTAYKRRIAGLPDEFDGTDGNPYLSEDSLVRAQSFYRSNRDLSLFITIGIYALNIIEANVDAHLDDKVFKNIDLSFRPSLYYHPVTNSAITGVNITYGF